MDGYKAISNLLAPKLFSLLFLPFFLFNGCGDKMPATYQGYAEGEFINVSSSQSGRLDKLFVKRGDHVAKGSNLFALECDSELIALDQASSERAAAQATLDDYQKGSRPQELEVIKAQLAQAIANSENAKEQLERNTLLNRSNALSKEQFDTSAALAKTTAAKVEELRNTLRVAGLAKRSDQIKAQKERIKQLNAAMEQIRWKLDEKSLKSRGNALIFDTLYREGEWVQPGGIIVRLLPPENIKVRFFVPQQIAEKLIIGQSATITSRADNRKLPARITYISTEAEYTPPVIYSNETKEKLIYMVEAYPSAADAPLLHPGQPVEISLER